MEKNKTSLVHVRLLSGIGSGSSAIFEHKNVHTMHFLFVFKLLFEKKGGGIFGDHIFSLWRPKIYTWSPAGARIKKLISDPELPLVIFKDQIILTVPICEISCCNEHSVSLNFFMWRLTFVLCMKFHVAEIKQSTT